MVAIFAGLLLPFVVDLRVGAARGVTLVAGSSSLLLPFDRIAGTCLIVAGFATLIHLNRTSTP